MGITNTSTGMRTCLATAIIAAAMPVAVTVAQPEIISLGSGIPNSVTVDLAGTRYIAGSGFGSVGGARWTLIGSALSGANIGGNGSGQLSADGQFQTLVIPNNSPQTFGNAATGVAPPFSMTPTLVPTAIPTTEFRGARWSASGPNVLDMGGLPIVPSLMVYGSSSSGGSSGTFLNPHAMSPNGRFIVGLAYISTYNSAAGATISANSFQWRAYIWDALGNGGLGQFTILPTPFRTSTNTWRRRTGNAYAVSNDGLVILGAQEHNVAGGPGTDPDGGRPVIWRWNAGTSTYDMSFLPNGTSDPGGTLFYTYSTTVGSMHMNSTGTIVVGNAVEDLTGNSFLAKWTWDAGTSTWSEPEFLGNDLSVEASWLPASVTSCGLPPRLSATGMTEDGNTVVGIATYSTCNSFMAGGFIWTSQDNLMSDWYDYLNDQNVDGLFANYGPIGDFGDPNRGLCKLGFPSGIASDGSAIVGFQGGNQLIPGATPWVVVTAGGTGCIAPTISLNPTASVLVSACTSSVILNAQALGTRPVTYQWYKDNVALSDGTTPSGADLTGATSFQMRINRPGILDFGTYRCEINGPCGAAAVTTNSVVSIDPAFPAAVNDTCAGAIAVNQGTNVLAPAQSPCAAYDNDPLLGANCVSNTKTDRWFSFTPGVTQEYRIETCGANYDTTLSIYTGCNGFELACNDNYVTGPVTGCTSSRSRIGRIVLDAGTQYLIRIAAPPAAFLSATSTMNLSIAAAPAAVANDDCSTAAAAILGTNAFDLTEASPSGEFSFCDSTQGPGRDVWFQYTPVLKGTMRAATCPGTTINTVLGIYEGVCGFEVACNDNANVAGCFNQSLIENFGMNAGQAYSFRVAGNSLTAVGAGTLTLQYLCDTDLNSDGQIDLVDLSTLLSNFGVGSGATRAMGDIDLDGDVDLSDLSQLLSAFGLACQ